MTTSSKETEPGKNSPSLEVSPPCYSNVEGHRGPMYENGMHSPPGQVYTNSAPGEYANYSPTTSDIGPASPEVKEDVLARRELADPGSEEIETRALRLSGDLVEQKHKLQKHIFYVVIVFVIVFFIVFLLTVVHLVCSEKLMHKEFPATATVLVAMMGSIPTILTGFLLVGLFSNKDQKEKDEKGAASDLTTAAKALVDIAKLLKPH